MQGASKLGKTPKRHRIKRFFDLHKQKKAVAFVFENIILQTPVISLAA